jgi:hypothetical protein
VRLILEALKNGVYLKGFAPTEIRTVCEVPFGIIRSGSLTPCMGNIPQNKSLLSLRPIGNVPEHPWWGVG